MKVYRFEDADTHEGVYNSGFIGGPADAFHQVLGLTSIKEEKTRRPPPRYDFPEDVLDRMEPGVVRFGFANTEQAREWFNSKRGREAMADMNTIFAEYEVPDKDVEPGRSSSGLLARQGKVRRQA